MSIIIGKAYKVIGSSLHAFEDGTPVIVCDVSDGDLYNCYDPVNDLTQSLEEDEIGKMVRSDSKIYDHVDCALIDFGAKSNPGLSVKEFIEQGDSDSAGFDDFWEEDIEIQPFDPDEHIEMNVEAGIKVLLGDFEFIDKDNTVILHKIYGTAVCVDEDHAELVFNGLADKELCTSYLIPTLFHGQIVNRANSETDE